MKTRYTPTDFTPLILDLFARNRLPGAEAAGMLSAFADRLCTVNQVMNLTAITEPQALVLRHLCDSAALCPHLPAGARMIDIGAGAGFPSVPVALIRPDLRVIALDSTAKRIGFLRDCAAALPIPNLGGLVARAEEAAHDPLHREQFDIATARAVAEARILAELCLPFVKVGGVFLAMKSGKAEEEVKRALPTIKRLGGQVREIVTYTLSSPEETLERSIVVIDKCAACEDALPRNYSQMSKKALDA